MASEYLKWKYRDECPEERREPTSGERRKNWWRYHWKYVCLGLFAAGFLCVVIRDRAAKVEPDCGVALVTRYQVTSAEAASIQSALEQVCPDTNGDGNVNVAVNVIQLDYTSTDLSAEAMKVMEANIDKLNFDFYTRQSGIFLLDDPENFQRAAQAMCYLDGSTPAEGASDWENMVRPWTDWPGSGTVELETCQSGRLWFGRRIITGEKDEAAFAGAQKLWNVLFSGG